MTDGSTGDLGEVRHEGDRASVRFERTLAASIERVWQALTAPEELAAWLDVATIEPHEGGAVTIDFDGGAVSGVVTRWDPPVALEYTWIIEGEPESVVRFELSAAGNATRLVLEHVALPESMGSGYGAGWHAHLDRLADLIGGRPVRPWDATFQAVFDRYRAQVT